MSGQYIQDRVAGTATPLGDGATVDQPLIDDQGRAVISLPDGQQVTTVPAGSTVPNTAQFAVGASAAPLSGSYPNGVTLLNASTSDQIIYVGPSGVTTSTGFPLASGTDGAGAAIDRSRWTDLTQVFAIASAGGALLCVAEL